MYPKRSDDDAKRKASRAVNDSTEERTGYNDRQLKKHLRLRMSMIRGGAIS
jgi:hypothetical protein